MTLNSCKKMIPLSIAVYIIQFLVFPTVFPKYYPRSNEAVFIFLIPAVLSAVIGICFLKTNIKGCLISDIVYCLAVCIYHGKGFYGIGLRGIYLDGAKPVYSFEYALIGILIIFVLLSLFRLSVFGVYRLVLKIKN